MQAKALTSAAPLIAWALAVSAAAAQPEALVYRCEREGIVAFADRPCALDAQPLHLPPETLSGYAPVLRANLPAADTPRRQSGRPDGAAAKKPPRGPGPTRKTTQRLQCQQLQADIDRVNSQMRAGYRGRRGEALRARWHALKERYYDERCLGVH